MAHRIQQHAHALGSEVYLTLVGDDAARLQDVFGLLWQELSVFEHTFSRFLAESELTYVNGRAGLPTEISPEFRELAETAYTYAKQTDGLYSPFVLPALQKAGYKGSWPHPARLGEAPDYSARGVADISSLQLSKQGIQIPVQAALDFGGIGKGYALDMLARSLKKHKVVDYWLSLGGDILASGFDVDKKPWIISIGEALNQEKTCAVFRSDTNRKFAVATSGTVKRAGKDWNHLIDPRTGEPTKANVLSATVAASSGVEADVYAKCLVLAGDAAERFAEEHNITSYVLQRKTKDGTMRVKRKGEFR